MLLEIFGSTAIFSVTAAVLMYHYYLSQRETESVLSEGIKGVADSELSDGYSDNFNPHRKLQRLNYNYNARQVSANDTDNNEVHKKLVKRKNVYGELVNFQAHNDNVLTDVIHNTEYNKIEYDKSIFDEFNNDISKFDNNFKENKILPKHTSDELTIDHVNKNNISKVYSSNSMFPNIENKKYVIQNSFTKSACNIPYEEQDAAAVKLDQKCSESVTCRNLKYNSEYQLNDITPPSQHIFFLNEQGIKKKYKFTHASGKEAKDDPLLHKISSCNVNYGDFVKGNNDSNVLNMKAKNYISSPLSDPHLENLLNHNDSSNYNLSDAHNIESDNKTVDQVKELYKHKVKYNDLNRKEKYIKDLNCKEKSNVLMDNTSHVDSFVTIDKAQFINKKSSSNYMLHTVSNKEICSKPDYRQRLYDKYKRRKIAYIDPSHKGLSRELNVNACECLHVPSTSTDKGSVNCESNPKNSFQDYFHNEHKVAFKNKNEEQFDGLGNQVQFQEQNESLNTAKQLLSNIRLKVNRLEIKKWFIPKINSFFASIQDHIQMSSFNHGDTIFSSIEETKSVDIGTQNTSMTDLSDLETFNNNSEEEQCKGCMDVSANAVNIPCGHCYLCMQCAGTILKIYKKCCICSNNVTSFENIYN